MKNKVSPNVLVWVRPGRNPDTFSVWPALLCRDSLLRRQVWTMTKTTHYPSLEWTATHLVAAVVFICFGFFVFVCLFVCFFEGGWVYCFVCLDFQILFVCLLVHRLVDCLSDCLCFLICFYLLLFAFFCSLFFWGMPSFVLSLLCMILICWFQLLDDRIFPSSEATLASWLPFH